MIKFKLRNLKCHIFNRPTMLVKHPGAEITHPNAHLIEKMALVHLHLGCAKCDTLLDALGHLAVAHVEGVSMFRESHK